MKWKKMDTAPKDGTHIMLFVEGAVTEGFFNQSGQEWDAVSLSCHGCGCCGHELSKPDAWMPLLQKPETLTTTN